MMSVKGDAGIFWTRLLPRELGSLQQHHVEPFPGKGRGSIAARRTSADDKNLSTLHSGIDVSPASVE
jgi:hypothetical protein